MSKKTIICKECSQPFVFRQGEQNHYAKKGFQDPKTCKPCRAKRPKKEYDPESTDPDWGDQCDVCGANPTVPLTGMCGPCTFGEADTINGNW